MLMLIYLFVLGSILLLTWPLTLQNQVKLSADIRKEIKDESLLKTTLIKRPLPLTWPFLLPNRFLLKKLGSKNLANRLSSADINLLPEDFLGIKELLILVSLLVVYLITKRIEPWWIAVIACLGFILPELYLHIRIKKRNLLILKALPDAIDLLTLCIEGGLDFMLGLQWVIKRAYPNPLIKELAWVTQEIRVGESRHEALRAMARRINLPEVFSFVNTLVHAERMGTPIYEVLVNLSEESRRRRFQRGERLALQAPIKMLFPLIFFILPVVAIIVAGPILLQFLQGGLPTF